MKGLNPIQVFLASLNFLNPPHLRSIVWERWLDRGGRSTMRGILGVLLLGISFATYGNAVQKIGSCPSGWNTSGNYCVAGSYAKALILKFGSCPSGWNTSGNYCVAGSYAKGVIFRYGSCPSGWNTSGNYCVK